MKISKMEQLFLDELKDIYNAEGQLIKALPKMAKAAKNPDLKKAFESHLRETEGHYQRLEQVFAAIGETPKSKTCEAMKGLVEEAKEAIDEDIENANLHDALLICCAQKVEHYEIATYGTLKAWAASLALNKVVQLLDKTLNEEKAADTKLTALAEAMPAGAAAEKL